MPEVLGVLLGLYALGAVVSLFVYRVRAGLGWWHGVRLTAPGGVGVGWLALTIAKSFAWPVVLGVWARNGRPEPRTLFNENARRRGTELA